MKKTIKFGLNKSTVQNLSNRDQKKVKGGIYTIEFHPCNTNEAGCIPDTEYTCSLLFC